MGNWIPALTMVPRPILDHFLSELTASSKTQASSLPW